MTYEFKLDFINHAIKSDLRWYHKNLLPVLESAKSKQARGIDKSIRIGQKLVDALDEKLPEPVVVPPHEVEHKDDTALMRPVEEEVLDIFYLSKEKGGADRYLHERYKKPPEERFYFRECTSWDYGWQQKNARIPPRDQNRGRCGIIRDTFYRKNNLGPDPAHYSQPAGATFSICSTYSCTP